MRPVAPLDRGTVTRKPIHAITARDAAGSLIHGETGDVADATMGGFKRERRRERIVKSAVARGSIPAIIGKRANDTTNQPHPQHGGPDSRGKSHHLVFYPGVPVLAAHKDHTGDAR